MTHPESTKCWFDRCDRPTDSGHAICEFHRNQSKAKRQRYREEGRCSAGGCPRWPGEGFKMCDYHRQYFRDVKRDKDKRHGAGTLAARRLRLEALAAYGGGCNVCGETDPVVIEFDHIDGLQSVDPTWPRGGVQLYRKLRQLGFPQGSFQLLCANCHRRKTYAEISRQFDEINAA